MADVASVTEEPEVQSEEHKLKHLEFVEEAIEKAIDYASKAYDYVKDNSGPLKPSVETIETTLKTVTDPVYEKFHDVPVEALKFVDRKVDESVTQLDSVLPPIVKDAANSMSINMVSIVKDIGVVGTTKELLVKMEPVAEEYASSAWKTLNHLPLVTSIVKALTPSATFVTEKYNQTVQENASFLPLVPTDKIARVFSILEPEAEEPDPVVGEAEAAEEVSGEGAEDAEEVVGEGA